MTNEYSFDGQLFMILIRGRLNRLYSLGPLLAVGIGLGWDYLTDCDKGILDISESCLVWINPRA